MSDNKNDIDLDKEIESLEGLLNEHDESLDDTFPLDDDFDDELSATPRTTQSKSGAGKYVAYFAFLALLGGGGYAAYKYLPNMLQNDTLMALQNNLNDRTATVEPQAIIPDTSSIALNSNGATQIVEPMQETDALPVAMDNSADEIIIIDASNENNDGGFGDVVMPVPSELTDVFDEKPAETIAEALAIAQTAEEEIIIVENTPVEEVMDVVAEVQDEIQDVIEEDLTTSFERVPALPILKGVDREEVLPPVVAEISIEEEPVLSEEIIEVVEPVLENTPVIETVMVEEPVIETPQISEPEVDLMETVVEEMKVPTAPVVEEIVVKEKTVTPVAVKKSEPKAIVVNNKPLAKVDGRVTQARVAMGQGHLQNALNLYQSVLNDNPSSTAALTGMQLAKAKLRLAGQQVIPQEASVEVFPVGPDAIKTNTQGGDLSSVMAQMAANPRDASLAVKVAQLYKGQGNTAKAVEYYRKALQLDVVYKSGLDRMAIYDALSTLQ
jgi:hypothetical protein